MAYQFHEALYTLLQRNGSEEGITDGMKVVSRIKPSRLKFIPLLSWLAFHFMVYYAQASAHFAAWKQVFRGSALVSSAHRDTMMTKRTPFQLTDRGNAAPLTTETLSLAAKYEAFRVWGECVRRHGNLGEDQVRELIQVVIDGWVVLQIARRIDPAAADGKYGLSTVDYRLARKKAKQDALDVMAQILEFDVARMLQHFDRFLSHRTG
ncbi:hypothetical protein BC826DRAFT_167549 [Russula brevipes]|nr:hypothetical protein BC826DRAFT_167549 [Russula brevipes]